MKNALQGFDEKETWDLIHIQDVPPEAKILPGKWVFDTKTDALGRIQRYRARWVVCGNFQDKSELDLYAAVAHMTSLRVFLLIVALFDFECEQVDVINAFLNALIGNEKVHVRFPTGFGNNDFACLLKRALYGLR